jgi:hypothetical protein
MALSPRDDSRSVVLAGAAPVASLEVHDALDLYSRRAQNTRMVIPGHISNGVVILDGDPALPEGAAVAVVYPAQLPKPQGAGEPRIESEKGEIPLVRGAADSGHPSAPAPKKRVDFPLVRTGTPGSLRLTNEQIHEILEKQDIEALTAQGNVPS